MSEGNEQKMTEAGAVELEEKSLDDASGGLLPAVKMDLIQKMDLGIDFVVKLDDGAFKMTPELKK